MSINVVQVDSKKMFNEIKPRLVDILFAAYKRYPEYGVETQDEAYQYLDWLYRADPQGFFVAIIRDQIAGFIASHGQWWDKYIGTFVGEIHEISVDPAYHGKGIGSNLMSRAEDYFISKGRNIAALWVGIKNVEAISFYEHKGYVKGETKGPWLRMRKYIGG